MGIFSAGLTRSVYKGATGIIGTSFRISLCSDYSLLFSNKNLASSYSILHKNHNQNNFKVLTNYCRINTYSSKKLQNDSEGIHKNIITTLKSSDLGNEPQKNPSKSDVKNKEFIYHKNPKDVVTDDIYLGEENLGLFRRFKLMYKRYWYVLIPVHFVTSTIWFGGFYYLSKSGVDIPSVLESLRLSETVIEKLKDSNMGHMAVAYLCYKIATPLRYAVTLGGTTISIKHLSRMGYIKPVPSKTELKEMLIKKKEERKCR